MRRLLLPSMLCVLLVACGPEPAPDETRRPEPQAAPAPAAAADAGTTSPITATANAYKDAARGAVSQTQDAAAQEKAQLDQAAQ